MMVDTSLQYLRKRNKSNESMIQVKESNYFDYSKSRIHFSIFFNCVNSSPENAEYGEFRPEPDDEQLSSSIS